jgi:hypothetical protein
MQLQNKPVAQVQHSASALAGSDANPSVGEPITPRLTAVVDSDAEARWMAWRARGAASAHRSGRIMSGVFVSAIIVVLGWLVVKVL